MLVMETEGKGKRAMKQRIIPRLEQSPRLAAQLSDNPDDTCNKSVVMQTGFCINIGWAGSQSSVSTDACETVILDEVDKYYLNLSIPDSVTVQIEEDIRFIVDTTQVDSNDYRADYLEVAYKNAFSFPHDRR